MNVGTLKKWLKDVPDRYTVNFSKVFVVPGEDKEPRYECIMDDPVIGLAKGKGHLRFMLWSKDLKGFQNLGKLKKLKKK